MTTTYTAGNTITLTISYTVGGVASAPDAAPSVKVFASDQTTQQGTTKTAAFSSTGVYTCDVTLPTTPGTYFIEASTTSGSVAIVHREEVKVVFAT